MNRTQDDRITTRWEYTVGRFNAQMSDMINCLALQHWLNQQGAAGWDLASIFADGSGLGGAMVVAVMKRLLP